MAMRGIMRIGSSAFARAAVEGGAIRVEGRDHSFDFTHVEDVTDGIRSMLNQLAAGERNLSTIHLVSGIPTTLVELASLAVARAAANVSLIDAPPRNFDVAHFYGDPSRALKLLGWTAQIDLPSGFSRLATDIEISIKDSAESRSRQARHLNDSMVVSRCEQQGNGCGS